MYQMFSSHDIIDMLMWYQTKHTGAWTNMNDHSDVAMGLHDYVMTWIHLPHYWPLVRGFLSQRASNGQYADYRSIPFIKSQWWGVLVFSWTVCWTNIWLSVILRHWRPCVLMKITCGGIQIFRSSSSKLCAVPKIAGECWQKYIPCEDMSKLTLLIYIAYITLQNPIFNTIIQK